MSSRERIYLFDATLSALVARRRIAARTRKQNKSHREKL